jgi:hypothetical protein
MYKGWIKTMRAIARAPIVLRYLFVVSLCFWMLAVYHCLISIAFLSGRGRIAANVPASDAKSAAMHTAMFALAGLVFFLLSRVKRVSLKSTLWFMTFFCLLVAFPEADVIVLIIAFGTLLFLAFSGKLK